MNERVLILRDAITKITQMLAGSSIKVTQRGITAKVVTDTSGKPIEVNLPYLPDNASEELCMAIQGFLDHEVACITFSDFALLKAAESSPEKSIVKLLEAARVEKCMAEKFTGSGYNLSVTGKFFLDKFVTPKLDEAISEGNVNKQIGILMAPMIRGLAGQYVFKEYMKDKLGIVSEVYSKIVDFEPKIKTLKSTADVIALAKDIHERLKEDENPSDEGDEGTEGGGKGKSPTKSKTTKSKDKSEEKAKDKPKDKSEEKAKDKPKDKSEEKAKDKSEGESEEDKSEDDKKDKSDPSDESSDEDAESGIGMSRPHDEPGEEDDGDGEESSETDPGEAPYAEDHSGKDIKLANASAVLDEIDKENANGYAADMSRTITEQTIDVAKHAKYLVYSKENDVIEPLKVGRGFDQKMLTDLTDKVEHMVGTLQKDLERAIAARSRKVWESGKTSGRLAPANLSRLALGDNRVFRRRHETTSKDVAVELVIDASGSMGGEKIHLATQAAYALSSVLERIGIQHEVICFTTGQARADSPEEAEKMGREFSRYESLYMPVLKGFGERLRPDIKKRFGWLPNSQILRNNIDGECLEVAARRLMARREAGKVMIVLSDGAPSAYGSSGDLSEHLKQVVKDIGKAGINIVGIGINSTAVSNYYPKNLVINKVADLPTTVIKELRHLLVS